MAVGSTPGEVIYNAMHDTWHSTGFLCYIRVPPQLTNLALVVVVNIFKYWFSLYKMLVNNAI